ncbi:CDF family Co(II)/Ni(II) efflux transporter DmeF [Vibrio ulleungensis]|uniref:CDF family Co(II)/Ni(II) efflux transporter DmeF n=1 Tax=Vibrio ulleungensis TaxID=2807619 RepID=A0ABS2HCS7_9VIBR|nr:CDF family Co(II)/Ni(II) efflux transporter DmeF [Vibrio ulleungensis]MBM7035398.1 CDF family Co(II)/Ni(II) efflux transporter DmeF [Vibrio ulleungensis]
MNEIITKHTHHHNFSSFSQKNERRTWYVLAITLVTMVVEIIAGTVYGSMALLADGWHMGTHAAAFCITLFTYRSTRKHINSEKFSYGVGKVGVLGGYTSAIALGIVALVMVGESVHRLFVPIDVQVNQSILVAAIGLTVNVVSIFILGHEHTHDHSHHHAHQHDSHSESRHHHAQDHNLKAAYFHVLVDALTSVLAIGALLVAKYVGWVWLDPIIGIVGALVITKWALNLINQTSPILLDENTDSAYQQEIVDIIERHKQTKVTDIHIWKVSADHYAASLVIVTATKNSAESFKQELTKFAKLHHLTIEVNHC